jgi:hypothetical protein
LGRLIMVLLRDLPSLSAAARADNAPQRHRYHIQRARAPIGSMAWDRLSGYRQRTVFDPRVQRSVTPLCWTSATGSKRLASFRVACRHPIVNF